MSRIKAAGTKNEPCFDGITQGVEQVKNRLNLNSGGIAVIIAIGLLALLLGLAIAFVTSTIIEKKATQNNDAMIVARLAARSAIDRAIMSMKQVSQKTDIDSSDVWSHHDVNYDYANGYFSTAADSKIYYDKLDENLTTTINGVPIVASLNETGDYDVTSNDAKTWVYLPLPSGYGTYPLIARVAYVVVADKGKIDPSAAIDSGLNAQLLGYTRGQGDGESYEPVSGLASNGNPGDVNKEITMINPDGTYVIGRPGRDVSELFLRCLGEKSGSTWFKQVYDQKLSSVYSPAGQLEAGQRWKDFQEMCSALNLINPKGDITDLSAINGFHNVFYLDNPPDAEAFWINKNGDLLRETNELYHRFNLMRQNWSELTVDSILSDPVPFSQDIPDNQIYSIYWLKNWKSPGGFPTADSARKQIAANLIDYNDTDSTATTDNPDKPTYVGLEKVPYINEVRLKFTGLVTEIPGANPDTQSTYICSLYLSEAGLELINMYGTSTYNTMAVVNLSGEYKWSPNPFGNDTIVPFSGISFNMNIPTSGRYTVPVTPVIAVFPLQEGVNMAKGLPKQINGLRITSLTVKLTDPSGNLYDYAYVDTGYPADFTVTANGSSQNLYIDYQIDDPRQNLLASDWGGVKSSGASGAGTLGTKNSVANPNPGGDADPEPLASEPWEVSTAYIRNSGMQSPWELGAIHRGKKWQTLNLKKYNSLEEMIGGGNAYIDGDANIYEQIKMTDKKEVYGKISINSKNVDVMRTLFEKIRVGSGYKIPGWLTADNVNADIAENMANTLILYNGLFSNRSEFMGNSSLIPMFTNYNGVGGNLNQNTDAKKEEIVGKFINLTKATEANLFTIVVVAQAIRDVGGAKGSTTGKFDQGVDEIMATQKVMATIQRSVIGDTYRIIKYEYINVDE